MASPQVSNVYTVAASESGARVAQNYMKLFDAHKMTRHNTLHVAANELLQLLAQNRKYVWRGNRTQSLPVYAALNLVNCDVKTRFF